MNASIQSPFLAPWRTGFAALALVLATACPALAGPGAHGPNGEHLDEKAPANVGAAAPRVEAQSELFELVAQLRGGEFTILVDRYATNEPVLGAKLEVESGSVKAVATFRAAPGDYVVTDPAFVRSLAAPGEHPLVFTLVAGQDADLLDGTLVTTRDQRTAAGDVGHSLDDGHDHDHGLRQADWTGAALLGLAALSGFVLWRQRRRRMATTPNRGLA
jgi:hypothetical protein